MSRNDIPRIAAPLLLAIAIVASYRPPVTPPPVELAPGEAPPPAAAQVQAGWLAALAPGSPGYDWGTSSAPVTVLEFVDFGCRYCASFTAETYPQLAAAFVRSGQVRWMELPFALGMFPNGDAAARAAACAAEQGRAAFAKLHDRLFARQAEWQDAPDPSGWFGAYAQAVGLDLARFASCYASGATEARVRAANDLADRMGVIATPTFFINGRRVEGALPAAQFRAVLQDALRQGHTH
jgi:protein-disulfide isomerase